MKNAYLSAFVASIFSASTAAAEDVEIYLVDLLDNKQAGYCVDISGGKGDGANPDNGLQGHTCYSPLGELLVDQIFDTEKFAENTLYMPKFDVCAQVASTAAGTKVDLATCDGSVGQQFSFTGEGVISPVSASEMCFPVGEDTRSGRSDVNQIKELTLQSCSDDMSAYQTWSVRSE